MKYHSRYLCQIPLESMLLPILMLIYGSDFKSPFRSLFSSLFSNLFRAFSNLFLMAYSSNYLTTKRNVNLSKTKQILTMTQMASSSRFVIPIVSPSVPPDHSYTIAPSRRSQHKMNCSQHIINFLE